MTACLTTRSYDQFEEYINQHDKMLRLCLKLAKIDIPAILEILKQIDVSLGDGADIEGFPVRELIDDNMVIAHLALAIHNEVNRRAALRIENRR